MKKERGNGRCIQCDKPIETDNDDPYFCNWHRLDSIAPDIYALLFLAGIIVAVMISTRIH